MFSRILTVAAATAFLATSAQAVGVSPISYDMPNGQTGAFSYWDDSYNGLGNPNISLDPLSGGVGDLTDGVIANQNWNLQSGLYVGWQSVDPVITFNFAQVRTFNSVTFHFDDSNGNGGVQPPVSVRHLMIDTAVPDGASGAPFAFLLALGGETASSLTFQINSLGAGAWVMLSEVEFDAQPLGGPNPVPLPAALPILTLTLGAIGFAARKARRSST